MERIIKYEIKLVSTKSVNPQFEKNLDKIIKKAFESSPGKRLMSGSSYVGITQLKGYFILCLMLGSLVLS